MTEAKRGTGDRGFYLHEEVELKELEGRGFWFIHRATGCEVFHLFREDRENYFAFIFFTPPPDNTGLPHILEHSVLSGSRRFPLKDPFLALLEGSVSTFLNAMTYPDRTVFPGASAVEKDYFNLLEVYGDSVFFPLLREETFMQEGCRIEAKKTGPELAGVVYNEMLGAYSTHETLVNGWSSRFLFPGTPYYFDSGGEPDSIPRLSYEEFKAFHRRYYRPSNCRIFLYGNIPSFKQLDFLEERVFSRFPAAEPGGAIPAPLPREILPSETWDQPRTFFITSPPENPEEGETGDGETGGEVEGEGEEKEGGAATITLNWKIPSEDPESLLALKILTGLLLGNPGCPLYKGVVESGIGEDLSPQSGLDSDGAEPALTVGVRGCRGERKEEFEALILKILGDLARQIPPELLAMSLHQEEFSHREIRGGVPLGLRLMDRSLWGWLRGLKPWDNLVFEETLGKIRKGLEQNPRYFEDLIQRSLLNNPHRLTLVTTPDREYLRTLSERQGEFLASAVRNLPPRELGKKNRRFRAFQKRPDSPGVSALIPVLHREDLPGELSSTHTRLETLGDSPLYCHELYTHGIIYLDFVFNVRGLSREEALLLPLWVRMTCGCGIPGLSYDQTALKLSLLTGGLYTFLEAGRVLGQENQNREDLTFRVKLLEKDLEPALALLGEIFLRGDLADPVRIRDLLLEQRNDFRSSLLPSGHRLCACRAAAKLSPSLVREELWGGIEYYLFLSRLAAGPDPSLPVSLGENFLDLRKKLFTRDRLLFNITCEPGVFSKVRRGVEDFAGLFPAAHGETGEALPSAEIPPGNEAVIFGSGVGYAAQVLRSSPAGAPEHAAEALLGHYLSTKYLWEQVRMKGGAYGVSASANGGEELFSFTSYRDPDPPGSLKVFAAALERFGRTGIGGRPPQAGDLEKAIIARVGKDSHPLSPGETGLLGLRRALYGITDEVRRLNREQTLSLVPADLTRAAGRLRDQLEGGVWVIMAPGAMAGKAPAPFSRLTLPA